MIKLPQLKPRQLRALTHWGMELLVVVVGVLLALAAAEWAAGRREAADHRKRIAQMDTAIEYVTAMLAGTQAWEPCDRNRLARLKALLDRHGRQWPGPPETSSLAPDDLLFPIPASILGMQATPLDAFEAAESAGAMAILSDEDTAYYRFRRLQFEYLQEAYEEARQAQRDLLVLSEPRLLSQNEVDTARRALASLEAAMLVTHAQGKGLREAYLQRSGAFPPDFWNTFEKVLAFSPDKDADCFTPLDPRDGRAWKGRP